MVQERIEVKRLREYLRIPSVHPDINYDGCVDWLKNLAQEIGLPVNVVTVAPGKPVVLMSWEGTKPDLPSLLLNSHMDVVPVDKEKWTHDPFAAEKDANGRIYARGAQDMKSVGIQFVEAVRRIKEEGILLQRTVHICFSPEEEVGGVLGTQKWLLTEEFKKLNVGCVFDESFATPTPQYVLFNAERTNYSFRIHCPGPSGHGAQLLMNTAGEKMATILKRFQEYRQAEIDKFVRNKYTEMQLGNVTTLNLTTLSGGVQVNVIPAEFVAGFDCRLSVETDPKDFDKWLEEICKEAGEGVYVEYINREDQVPITKLDSTNPYWISLKKALDEKNIPIINIVCPGATDSRFYRKLGISAFGLTALNNTPLLVHGHDECVDEDVFLKGIEVYYHILRQVACT